MAASSDNTAISRRLVSELQCDVVAVENDPRAIDILSRHVSKIHNLDLNNPDWIQEMREHQPFDYVISADVLEHLYDPATVLGGMRSLLNSTGEIVLSIPHVGHAAVTACLLDDDFDYRDIGLLDRRHIRFLGSRISKR